MVKKIKLTLILAILFFTSIVNAGQLSYTTSETDTLLGYTDASTAYGRSMWSLATEAAFKALVNLEAGTDFTLLASTHDTAAELDALYEAELNNSAGLLAALSDETGTGVAVFGTAPTFTTSITIGSAGINETELEILDGLTGKTGSDLSVVTGTKGTSTYHAVWNADGDLVGGVAPLATTHDTAAELNTLYLEATQLDDTKGNGDTTFIYSADKVFDLLALKAPLASPTFTGTVVLPSNQALLGSPTFVTSILPSVANGGSVGNATYEVSDIFLAAGGILYGENDQSNTLTSSATGWTANLNLAATTYGSDGSVSDAELLYNDATGPIQAQLDARALESVVGTSLNADDLELDGAVLQTAAEILHSDAAGAVTGRWTQVYMSGAPQASEPGDVAIYDIVTANNNDWDPLDHPGDDDYRILVTGIGPFAGVIIDDITGKKYSSGINTPTLIAASLNDTSTPHVLIQAEMESKYISNLSGAMHLDVLADAAGWSVIFIVENAADFVIHPADSQTWYLNGTVLAADRTISNTAATIGESLACISTGTYVFCESKYSDFVSAAE